MIRAASRGVVWPRKPDERVAISFAERDDRHRFEIADHLVPVGPNSATAVCGSA